MAKKENEKKRNLATKELKNSIMNLNKLARNVLGMANGNTNSDRDVERLQLRAEIDEVVKNDLKEISDVEGSDMNTLITRFITREMKHKIGNSEAPTRFDIQDLFENESNGILAHFEERYRNYNLQLEDLHIIRKQLKELDLAISVTRDAILTADDISSTVSRTISFTKGGITDEDLTEYLKIIDELEKEFNIPKKLKNHIVPNSLTFGNYFVYTIPYSEIFSKAMYDKMKESKQGKNFKVRESGFTETDLNKVLENFGMDDEDNKGKTKEYLETANSLLESVTVDNDSVPLPILEGTGLGNMVKTISEDDFVKMADKATKSGLKSIKDNVADFNETDSEYDFTEFSGCYMQLIDPRRIIPVKILDKTLGYYYLHEEKHKRIRSPFTSNFNVDLTTNATKVESDFLMTLSEKIIQDFDKKFLEENNEFKETIINAMIYHNIYGKNIRFQFIPAKYITEFPVNEDENGNGQSILIDALFYAKLYLSLLIFKMISVISRSNDQRLYYVRTSGMSKDVTNSVQDIVRQMRQREINFNDLLNYKSIVSKVGAGRDIYMPVGPDDLRGIDFETLAGQDVQMNSDMMDMLKTSYINATEVPSVMMQFVNEADYARTLDMGNARFANTTASYQIDYNQSIGELYRKLILFSGKEIPVEVVRALEYKLSTPTSLAQTNNNNLINEVQQEIDFINKVMIGTNSNPTELDNAAMDVLTKRVAKLRVGSIKWDAIQEMLEDVYLEAKEKLNEKKDSQETEE